MAIAPVSNLRPVDNHAEIIASYIERWRTTYDTTAFSGLADSANWLDAEAGAILDVMAAGLRSAEEAGPDSDHLRTLRPSIQALALDGVRQLIEVAAMFRDIEEERARAGSRRG